MFSRVSGNKKYTIQKFIFFYFPYIFPESKRDFMQFKRWGLVYIHKRFPLVSNFIKEYFSLFHCIISNSLVGFQLGMWRQIEGGNKLLQWERKEEKLWCARSAFAGWGLAATVMFQLMVIWWLMKSSQY